MAFVHGKNTVFSLNGSDLSAYTKRSNLERRSNKHDVTVYGQNSERYAGGLLSGAFGAEGVYDNSTSGPHDIIEPLIGTVVSLVRKPEGTGSGLPIQTVDVLVEKYTETNPVDDMVAWAVDLQLSGDVTSTNQ